MGLAIASCVAAAGFYGVGSVLQSIGAKHVTGPGMRGLAKIVQEGHYIGGLGCDFVGWLLALYGFASTEENERVAPKVKTLDHKFESLTVECPPVWGEHVAKENGYDSEIQWWFYRRPRTPGPDFELELQEAGLAPP